MKPTLTIRNAVIYQGNNLEVLPTLPDNSVDSIVCDPPYELGFMGKSWDNSGIAYSVELWQECLRVLKPGGHLLAFGGTRTWHRLAVAIEDAGFEIRDNIAWLYGSGFPKSHNISKAIDKYLLNENLSKDLLPDEQAFCEWMQQHSGITISQSKEVLGSARFITGQVEIVNTATADKPHLGRRAMIPTFAAWQKIKPLLAVEAPEWVEALVKEPPKPAMEHPNEWNSGKGEGTAGTNEYAGWGTALKPAHEPIVVARKPLTGTVAQNVLEHGVGGINVDACRIGFTDTETDNRIGTDFISNNGDASNNANDNQVPNKHYVQMYKSEGRWPANIILDEYTAELLDKQSGVSKSGKAGIRTSDGFNANAYGSGVGIKAGQANGEFGDSGGASRFFYVAKASKRDRNEGLDELPEVRHSDRNATDGVGGDNPRNRTNQPKQNFHPTVKPTALMQYLIRLVTPDNGVVLDPFAGSGSTGKAAILENKHFIGIEVTPEYLPIIEGRLTHAYETLDSKEVDLFE
jgi:DNA modification methylase